MGDDEIPVPQGKSPLDGFGKAVAMARTGLDDSIDHDFDVMPHLSVEPDIVGKGDDPSVNPGTNITLFQKRGEQIAMFAFLAADDRGENREPRLLRKRFNAVDNLLTGLGRNHFAAFGAISGSDPGEEDAEKVVNLRYGSNRASRVLAGGFLGNRNRRTQAGNMIDIRFRELAEKLPRIAGEAFDIPTLSFRIERIEGERTFTAPADSGKTDQPVSRQT